MEEVNYEEELQRIALELNAIEDKDGQEYKDKLNELRDLLEEEIGYFILQDIPHNKVIEIAKNLGLKPMEYDNKLDRSSK